MARETPVVSLEAGRGPENPPCPACGQPLFGWVGPQRGLDTVRRCELCGLGVMGEPEGPEEARRALAEATAAGAVANRAGLAASLGGAGWAGLEPRRRYLFTPQAAQRLAAEGGRRPARARWAPLPGLELTWQTLLNSFTFGRNVALAALGRGSGVPAPAAWQRQLDALISVVLALPALVIAVPLELAAALARRGSALSLQLEPQGDAPRADRRGA